MNLTFTCPRSCPLANEATCRFAALIPGATVNSHTVKIKAEFKDEKALRRAVGLMKGKWLGWGKHDTLDAITEGHGFRLPSFTHPLIATADGELAFDDYGGAWGDLNDIEILKAEYQIAVAEANASQQGWTCERTEAGLLVYHPSGGTMLVSKDSVDACNFHGHGCHEAIMALGLPWESAVAKPEYSQVKAEAVIG